MIALAATYGQIRAGSGGLMKKTNVKQSEPTISAHHMNACLTKKFQLVCITAAMSTNPRATGVTCFLSLLLSHLTSLYSALLKGGDENASLEDIELLSTRMCPELQQIALGNDPLQRLIVHNGNG